MKRYTWKGGDLSAEVALGLTVELFDWLADNPSEGKAGWPRWAYNGGDVARTHCDCFLCHIAKHCSGCLMSGRWHTGDNLDITCKEGKGLFSLWLSTANTKDRTAYARMIADRACDELRKLRKGGKA